MSRQQQQPQIDWCRRQQIAALEHIRRGPDCGCGHPQCCPENNIRWLLDAFGEEIELTYEQASEAAA